METILITADCEIVVKQRLAMEKMDDLYTKLQVLLMRKDKECGKLRFLTSRTTVENSEHVQDVCDSVKEILHSCKIPVEEDASVKDPQCVQAYKYLLLNTFFECQENLSEDLVNGHLVDMCPPLSPYLLCEILWSLRYEAIVAESVLHVPLDLCVEIIEISRRCVGLLEFQRSLDFVAALTFNCYKKLHLIEKSGTQTTKLEESLELLFMNCQELVVLFSDGKFTRLAEVAGLKRSERLGLVLEKTLALMKNCLESRKDGVELSPEMDSIYKITFGRAPTHRPNDGFAHQLRMMDQEFVHMSLKIMKEIDCNTYVGWASLESAGSSSVSLQRSIGSDCYHLIEFMKSFDYLLQHDHLIEILQQFSSKPLAETSCSELDLENLRKGASEGKKDCVKELLNRYKEWNHEMFDVIQKNKSSLDKEDFLNLLEYLTLVMTKPGQEEHKRRVYTTVTQVLLHQNIPELYESVLEYILKHDGRNTLESLHTEESFNKFMAHNANFKSPRNLRILLFFLLKNPRKILTILIKIAVGDSEYANVMVSPQDLILLSPVMNIRDKPDDTLLLAAIRAVCLESVEWNAKKFAHLVQAMLENCVFTADKIINNVFIPCLEEKAIALSNVRSILNCLRRIAPSCTKETHSALLLEALGRRMSRVRNDSVAAKYSGNEVLSMMTRIVEILLRKLDDWLESAERTSLVERLDCILEPIDKPHFASLLLLDPCAKIDVYDTIKDYERRCFLVMNRVEADREIAGNNDERTITFNDFGRFDEDFLRYIIVKSTETEYVKFATQATIFHADDFRCKDEYDTYDKIVRVTVEAAVYCLEFPACNPPDSLACLLKGLARFTRAIASLEEVRNVDKLYVSLADNVRALDKSIRNTSYSTLYTPVILLVNNRPSSEPVRESLQELIQSIDNFGNKCLEIAQNHEVHFNRPSSSEATRYRIAHEFITECMSVTDDGSYQSLCNIYKLLCSHEQLTDVS